MYLGDGYFIHHIGKVTPVRGMGLCVEYCWEESAPDTFAKGDWCCSVQLINTDGKWMLAEHLYTNERLPMRVRHEGVARMVPFIEATCLAHGKQLMICTSSKGLVRGLGRMGVAKDTGLKVLLGVER